MYTRHLFSLTTVAITRPHPLERGDLPCRFPPKRSPFLEGRGAPHPFLHGTSLARAPDKGYDHPPFSKRESIFFPFSPNAHPKKPDIPSLSVPLKTFLFLQGNGLCISGPLLPPGLGEEGNPPPLRLPATAYSSGVCVGEGNALRLFPSFYSYRNFTFLRFPFSA